MKNKDRYVTAIERSYEFEDYMRSIGLDVTACYFGEYDRSRLEVGWKPRQLEPWEHQVRGISDARRQIPDFDERIQMVRQYGFEQRDRGSGRRLVQGRHQHVHHHGDGFTICVILQDISARLTGNGMCFANKTFSTRGCELTELSTIQRKDSVCSNTITSGNLVNAHSFSFCFIIAQFKLVNIERLNNLQTKNLSTCGQEILGTEIS